MCESVLSYKCFAKVLCWSPYNPLWRWCGGVCIICCNDALL